MPTSLQSADVNNMALLDGLPAVKAFYNVYNQRNPDLTEDAVAPHWVTNPQLAPDQQPGPAGMRQVYAGAGSIFASIALKIDDVIAQGDRVAVRNHLTVVQSAPFLGVAGSEAPVTFMGVDVHRLGADGKIVETWHVEDWLSFLLQRGVLPIGG